MQNFVLKYVLGGFGSSGGLDPFYKLNIVWYLENLNSDSNCLETFEITCKILKGSLKANMTAASYFN